MFKTLAEITMPAVTVEAPMSFSDGVTMFGQFMTMMLGGIASVFSIILSPTFWVCLLPVFAYLFVVLMAALRSLYKG